MRYLSTVLVSALFKNETYKLKTSNFEKVVFSNCWSLSRFPLNERLGILLLLLNEVLVHRRLSPFVRLPFPVLINTPDWM